mmetsp:Transcript_10287/g.30480  ORF Transcript_10287/g.30480 Transcript_10287/m.30480 type:complete len:203 (+) Transcript_10287:924-1532(+)
MVSILPKTGCCSSGLASPSAVARAIAAVASMRGGAAMGSTVMGMVEWAESTNLRGSAFCRWPKQRGSTTYRETKSSCSSVALAQTEGCTVRSACVTSERPPSAACLSTTKPRSTSVAMADSPRSECGSWCSASSTREWAKTSIVSAWPAPKTEGSQPPCRASRWSGSSLQTVISAKRRAKSAQLIQKTPESSRSMPSSCLRS